MELNIYIPTVKTFLASGSGVVGLDSGTVQGMVNVFNEGNIYGACNLHDIRDRITVAAHRMICVKSLREGKQAQGRYATTARQLISESSLLKVGSINMLSGVINISDKQNFECWASSYEPVKY